MKDLNEAKKEKELKAMIIGIRTWRETRLMEVKEYLMLGCSLHEDDLFGEADLILEDGVIMVRSVDGELYLGYAAEGEYGGWLKLEKNEIKRMKEMLKETEEK